MPTTKAAQCRRHATRNGLRDGTVEAVDLVGDTDRESSDGHNSNETADNNRNKSGKNTRTSSNGSSQRGDEGNSTSNSNGKRRNMSSTLEPQRTCKIATRYQGIRVGDGVVEGDGQQTHTVYDRDQGMKYFSDKKTKKVNSVHDDVNENGVVSDHIDFGSCDDNDNNGDSSDSSNGDSSNNSNNVSDRRYEGLVANDVMMIKIDSDNDNISTEKNNNNNNDRSPHDDYVHAPYNPLRVYESS